MIRFGMLWTNCIKICCLLVEWVTWRQKIGKTVFHQTRGVAAAVLIESPVFIVHSSNIVLFQIPHLYLGSLSICHHRKGWTIQKYSSFRVILEAKEKRCIQLFNIVITLKTSYIKWLNWKLKSKILKHEKLVINIRQWKQNVALMNETTSSSIHTKSPANLETLGTVPSRQSNCVYCYILMSNLSLDFMPSYNIIVKYFASPFSGCLGHCFKI